MTTTDPRGAFLRAVAVELQKRDIAAWVAEDEWALRVGDQIYAVRRARGDILVEGVMVHNKSIMPARSVKVNGKPAQVGQIADEIAARVARRGQQEQMAAREATARAERKRLADVLRAAIGETPGITVQQDEPALRIDGDEDTVRLVGVAIAAALRDPKAFFAMIERSKV